MKTRIQKLTLFILFLGTFILSYSQKINAQEKSTYATAEDVAIAFYKTGNIVPDFEKWVKQQEPYSTTALARRPKIMERELIRFKRLYSSYDPLTDILRIKTSSSIEPFKTKNKAGGEIYAVRITLDPDQEIEYFPYEHLNRNIMLVPNNFKSLKVQSISKYQYDRIKKMTRPKARYPLILNFRADKADMEFPYEVDGLPQWAFSVDIASMESWTEEGNLIWEYTAHGYISNNEMQIQNLYQENSDESNSSGSVKPLGSIK
jgi:hypothetical protein